jgi:AraC family transcriptional regulator of adaptative response / methylphosphotriester-DNA alkyltransferase methyltransferase
MEGKELTRSQEIVRRYFEFIHAHIEDVASGRMSEFMQLNQIARELAVSHKHLIDVLKEEKGNHPCHFYDAGIIQKANELLINTDISIAQIAQTLTYDPSNFSKFYKKWTGETPGSFRSRNQKDNTL